MKVRFAPSPTGYIHLGNARTALFNYLLASQKKGQMILRIEDTDVERSKDEYVDALIEDLRWLGLKWQEGPDCGGPNAPYRQSERQAIYEKKLQELIEKGHAYHCFCSEERLNKLKDKQREQGLPPRYDNQCRALSSADVQVKLKEKQPHTIRFKVDGKNLIFKDLIRGEIDFDLNLIGDFVICRTSGVPTFHLTVCVDDGMMGVTHVLRGEDHLPNTPRHILLFKAMGLTVPEFGHFSLLKGPGGEPLSKRLGAMSMREYRSAGWLPESLVNYMALLGWAPGDNRELFDMAGLCDAFSLSRIVKSAAIFDPVKLDWIAGQHMRQLKTDAFIQRAKTYLLENKLVEKSQLEVRQAWYDKALLALHDNITFFGQLKEKLAVFDAPSAYEDIALLREASSQTVLKKLESILSNVLQFSGENYSDIVDQIKKETGIKGKSLFMPIRLALTGACHGPEMKRVADVVGKEEALVRIEKALTQS